MLRCRDAVLLRCCDAVMFCRCDAVMLSCCDERGESVTIEAAAMAECHDALTEVYRGAENQC